MAVAAPDNHQVLVFLTQLVAILLVARTLGYLLHRVGQPAVVGELLAGVVLGPSVLGKIAPGAFDWLFPDGDMQSGMLYAVAWLGLVLMLSAAGFESDLGVLKKLGRPVAIISVASLVVPMIAGFALGMVTVADLRGIDTTTTIFALFIAVALSISSLPVAVRVLSEMGMIRRDVGQLILACAIANDVVGWVLLGVVVGFADSGALDPSDLLRTVLYLILYLGGMFVLGRVLVDRVLQRTATMAAMSTTPTFVLVTMVVMSAALTQALHLEAVLGAFVAGLVIGGSPWRDERASRLIEQAAGAFLAPVFFATAGLRIDLAVFADSTVLFWTAALVVVATLGKAIGASGGASIVGLPRPERMALAAGLNARGALEIVIASVGLSIGVLNEASYGAVVAMALITTLIAPPALRIALRNWPGNAAEQQRLAEEEQRRQRLVIGTRPPVLSTRRGDASSAAAQFLHHTWPPGVDVTVVTAGSDASIPLVGLAERFKGRRLRERTSQDDTIENLLQTEAARGPGSIVTGLPPGSGSSQLPAPIGKLLDQTQIPMVLVRDSSAGPSDLSTSRKVLVPVAGTKSARAAQELAANFARSTGSEVICLNVDTRQRVPYTERRMGDTTPLSRAEPALFDALETMESYEVSARALALRGRGLSDHVARLIALGDVDMVIVGTTLREHGSQRSVGPAVETLLRGVDVPLIVVTLPPGWAGWHRVHG
ncbi:MAG: cation:proton antiporter [Acidimicrobiia bacterium]|nr:cation:proton antiporter [Acidimicrobiia bacterium]MBP8179728.1 cation:proton antiporter [Acidimicrobiia bacterium]